MNMKDVKMRVLIDVLENLRIINDERFHVPIIHFKHVKQQSDEEPIWEYLDPLLVSGFSFILNGNITKQEDIRKIKNQLESNRTALFDQQVKGIMIGRALITNPSVFLEFQEKKD